MDSQEIVRQIAKAVEPLFTKEKNTLYEVHIIQQSYSGRINVFFEWHRMGRATVSRPITVLPDDYRHKLDVIARQLEDATQIKVTVS
ncbi:hypothetical protein [Eupransor demetentiae]|uniref:Uncharacterized protein n=1 Tax=Eupransor demetentiae TaxID=3109584 RepID=A0ABM9N412_9LACO|nr:hypothetical protein R54876_GBNLAHCA_00426 [Lactobacillaceae bacterium LMG 33000]